MLIIISVLLLGYSIYLYLDQKRNIHFRSPKSKMVPFAAAVLVAIGIANYVMNGQKLADLGSCIVLVIFALIMLISRNGVGESGIFFEGIRVSWKQISNVSVTEQDGEVCLSYTRKNITKTMIIMDTMVEDADKYIKKLRKLYHFGK